MFKKSGNIPFGNITVPSEFPYSYYVTKTTDFEA